MPMIVYAPLHMLLWRVRIWLLGVGSIGIWEKIFELITTNGPIWRIGKKCYKMWLILAILQLNMGTMYDHVHNHFFGKTSKDKTLKDYLWRTAKSNTVFDYKFWIEEMKKFSESAYGWLMIKDISKWIRSHFFTKFRSDILLNNLCEFFNKSHYK